ncbi:hypothetical protein DFH94DRAFT_717675 [Russula ochroleuca]|uniref:Uncharacterized protein n=1 Tax=Russula ochroleuca TaxID=152965 RepID=A0A9P5TCQ7_9AGAM|nr:hypothetical protein DFH94DRAFT_717675 [Russula ochroleuca]
MVSQSGRLLAAASVFFRLSSIVSFSFFLIPPLAYTHVCVQIERGRLVRSPQECLFLDVDAYIHTRIHARICTCPFNWLLFKKRQCCAARMDERMNGQTDGRK